MSPRRTASSRPGAVAHPEEAPPTIEELLQRIEELENHTHTYRTGKGQGPNNTEAETGLAEVPEGQ